MTTLPPVAVPQTTRRLTEAEYFAIERAAEIKSEFYDGEMFAMSGGTRGHSRIGTNIGAKLNNKLRDHRCQPFNAELRVKVEATGLYDSYDRGKKFQRYQQIPSLQEYLFVSQDEPRIEHFVRQADNTWVLREVVGMTATLTLPTLQITISLAEVFAKVDFSPDRPQNPPRRRS